MGQIGKVLLQPPFETYHNLHEVSKKIWGQRKKGWREVRLQALTLQHNLEEPGHISILALQPSPAITLKMNKSSLFPCKTGACLFRGTEEAPGKNFHNHIFFLTAFMRMQKCFPPLASLERPAEWYWQRQSFNSEGVEFDSIILQANIKER